MSNIPTGNERLRPFVLTKDFDLSKRFYEAIGYALIGANEKVHWLQIKRTRRSAILLRLDEMGVAPR